MNGYFESEITRLEKELTDLKTSQQKFAGQAPLVTKSANMSIGLSITSDLIPAAIGHKAFKLTFQKPTFFVPTLAHYYDNANLSEDFPRTTRYMYFNLGRLSSNQYIIDVRAYGTQWSEGSDAEVIKGGGSVSLNNVLTVQATDDFTLEAL
jgi:hypothetical protein